MSARGAALQMAPPSGSLKADRARPRRRFYGRRVGIERQAETEATAIRVSATAEKNAAEDRAEAVTALARAESDAICAQGLLETGKAEAEAERLLNEFATCSRPRSSSSS